MLQLSYSFLTLGVVIILILILISPDPIFLRALSSLDNSHKTNIRILAANDNATVNAASSKSYRDTWEDRIKEIRGERREVVERMTGEKEETRGEALGCGLSEKL